MPYKDQIIITLIKKQEIRPFNTEVLIFLLFGAVLKLP